MKFSGKKLLAAVQIVLQLCPPSFLLYLAPTSNVSAQAVTRSEPDESSQKQTESRIAKATIQAGTLLSGDNAGALNQTLVSTSTGMASAELQQWLNQFGTARVNISTDERFTLNDSSMDILLPLYDYEENLLFTQLGGRRHDDRNIINAGIGYRYFSDKWMLGNNIFYDRQVSGVQHDRLGIGVESGWDYIKLAANGYFRLSDWKSSSRYTDYDERVANGFDIRLEGYLPAWPQLGTNVVYEQYYGDSVGLFGDDEDDRQSNPHAITLGLNYTPFPLLTFGVDQKWGKNGEKDTQLNLTFNWLMGMPLSAQLDGTAVAQHRSLMGSRHDLVARNNNIVLEYRKQDLISLALPASLAGKEQSRQNVSAKVKTKYGLESIEWQAASFLNNGGKIAQGSTPEQFVLTLPAWQGNGINSYTLTGIAWDKNGNKSNASEMKVNVSGIDVTTLQSSVAVTPGKVPADGTTTARVTVSLKTSQGEHATGLASRLTTELSASTTVDANIADSLKKATITGYSETAPGEYAATLTSGTQPETLLIQPLIDKTVRLVSAKLIEEAVETLPQLAGLDTSATRVVASGAAPITLTAHVIDQYERPLKGIAVNWTADAAQATLSSSQTSTNEQGDAQIQVTSNAVVNTIITAQLDQGRTLSSPTLSFVADTATAKVVSINSEKQQVVANNNDTNTLTAQVTDDFNHPLEGVTVNWTVEKTDNTRVGSQSSLTDSHGKATFALKSAKVGTVTVTADVNGKSPQKTESITFVADNSTQKISAITMSKTQAAANGNDGITYTATVTNAQGEALQNMKVLWSADTSNARFSATETTSDANGQSQVVLMSTSAGNVVVSARTEASTTLQADKVTFVADATTAKLADITSDRQSVVANGKEGIIISATVTDASGNLLEGAEVNWSSSPAGAEMSVQTSKTNSSGVAQVQVSSKTAGSYSVDASINGSSQRLSDLNFTADSDSLQVSTLVAEKLNDIVADKDSVALTASVMDANNNPVPGVTVNWSSSETSSTFSRMSSVTDQNGHATTSFSSLKAGSITVTATAGVSSQSQTLQVVGNIETAQINAVTADNAQAIAEGPSSVTWTADVTDANTNMLKGVTVNWTADNQDIQLSSANSITSESGKASVSGKSLKAGSVKMTASLTSPASQLSATTVTFIGDAKTARVVKVTASTDHVAANTAPVTYTATVTDANDNPLQAVTVSWTTTLNNLSAATSDTNDKGEAAVQLSGSEFGNANVTASINGSSLSNGSTIFMGSIEDTWNIPSSTQSNAYTGETIYNFLNLGFVVTGNTTGPTSLIWSTNYGAYSVLTAELTDEKGNPQTVTFRGQVANKCTFFEFNSASGCTAPGNAPKITYVPEDGSNAALPKGNYRGVITFNGRDWHSSWALSYTITTTLVVN